MAAEHLANERLMSGGATGTRGRARARAASRRSSQYPEPDDAGQDEVDRDDVIEQVRNYQDQDAGQQGDDRLEMADGDHESPPAIRLGPNPDKLRSTRKGSKTRSQTRAARTAPPGHDGKRIYRSILEKSATASVAARISLSSLSRFARTALSSVLTVTFSKKASTCGRSLAIALMAAAKSSLATAPEASALAMSIALASARSSAWP